jgi:hypothetical protein
MKTVIVEVAPTGEITIDAVGFSGASCEQATKFLEEALGTVSNKAKKPEYHQRHTIHSQQKVGG